MQTAKLEEIQQDYQSNVKKWVNFIENFQKKNNGTIPDPFHAVNTLGNKYLSHEGSSNSILDIGCETGKNAKSLIEKGYKVTILDIAPNAIQYTKQNLEALKLGDGVVDSIVGDIESFNIAYGPFKAVVGTYAFSFITPNLFNKVMKNNVLGRVESNGYFVGGFFGEEHSWAKDPELTIMTKNKLSDLLKEFGFSICEITEKKEETPTVLDGNQLFHTIDVIAKRII